MFAVFVCDSACSLVLTFSALVSALQHQKCMAIPPRAVILYLKQLQDQGCPVDLNGVSETTVDTHGDGDDACVDTAESSLCSLVTTGLLSCSVDFCPGSCPHASACDATCGFCQQTNDGGGDHTDTDGGRRSLQISIDDSPCDPSAFQARTDRVNVQCCDNDQCGSGVPTTCDAKCLSTCLVILLLVVLLVG